MALLQFSEIWLVSLVLPFLPVEQGEGWRVLASKPNVTIKILRWNDFTAHGGTLPLTTSEDGFFRDLNGHLCGLEDVENALHRLRRSEVEIYSENGATSAMLASTVVRITALADPKRKTVIYVHTRPYLWHELNAVLP